MEAALAHVVDGEQPVAVLEAVAQRLFAELRPKRVVRERVYPGWLCASR